MSDDERKRARPVKIHAVIDRIEDNDMAVILLGADEKAQVDFPVSLLPNGATDGDHLSITIKIDEASRASMAERIKTLQQELLNRSSKKK